MPTFDEHVQAVQKAFELLRPHQAWCPQALISFQGDAQAEAEAYPQMQALEEVVMHLIARHRSKPLEEVVFSADAWVGPEIPVGTTPTVRPRDDPNRREALNVVRVRTDGIQALVRTYFVVGDAVLWDTPRSGEVLSQKWSALREAMCASN